jgi:hypothetical protein
MMNDETLLANDECRIMNNELKNNSYFSTHNSEFAEGTHSELGAAAWEIQR